jgi:hypothetical protein
MQQKERSFYLIISKSQKTCIDIKFLLSVQILFEAFSRSDQYSKIYAPVTHFMGTVTQVGLQVKCPVLFPLNPNYITIS